jgi:hypothetical protein
LFHPSVITLQGESWHPRLLPQEVEEFARFAYAVHDHLAVQSAQPIFWLRIDKDLSHFWN